VRAALDVERFEALGDGPGLPGATASGGRPPAPGGSPAPVVDPGPATRSLPADVRAALDVERFEALADGPGLPGAAVPAGRPPAPGGSPASPMDPGPATPSLPGDVRAALDVERIETLGEEPGPANRAGAGGGGGGGGGAHRATSVGELPEEAFAACLAGLSGMGPLRLTAMLRAAGPAGAWGRIVAGRRWSDPAVLAALGPQHERLVERWRREATVVEPAEVWREIVSEGVGVAVLGSSAYPPALADDIEPPALLFHRGSPEAIAGPRVAIVGTRQCTQTGTSVALELGRDLTDAGVSIVSGLATGIDAAAHRGALVAHRAATIRAEVREWAAAAPSSVSRSPTPAPADQGATPVDGPAPPRSVDGAEPATAGGAARPAEAAGPALPSGSRDRPTGAPVSASGGRDRPAGAARPAEAAAPAPAPAPVPPPPPAAGARPTGGRAPAAPIGVVGNGLDIVYPPKQGELWRAVAEAGVLVSETPLGKRPERWRFPARNRIIAALSDLVVVVESHRKGGSLYTVEEADRRGIDVLAVPGSVRNPAAAGTNALIAEGRAPVTGADDVIVALGMQPAGRRPRADTRQRPDEADQPVLDALGWQPATLDQLVLRTGLAVGALVMALGRLGESGWVDRRGGWYERVAGGGA
jgi:predicted Rossmann fold nucleotide-binding protein DprA/Smf involved in DNA uptake